MNSNDEESDNDMEDMFGSNASSSNDDDNEVKPNANTVDQDVIDMFGDDSSSSDDDEEDDSNRNNVTKTNGAGSSQHTTTQPEHQVQQQPIPKRNGTAAAASSLICNTTTTTTKTTTFLDKAQANRRKRVAEAILARNQKKRMKLTPSSSCISNFPGDTTSKKKGLPSQPSDKKQTTFYRSVEMDHYWKNLLEWDFITDLNESQQQRNNNATTTTTAPAVQDVASIKQHEEKPLPDTFGSCQEYKARWSPLLLQEVKSQALSELSSEQAPQVWARGAGMCSIMVEPLASTASASSNTLTVLVRQANHNTNANDQIFVNDVLVLVQDSRTLFDAAQGKLLVSQQDPPSKPKKLGIVGLALNHKKTLDGLKLKVSLKQWQSIGKRDMFLARVGSNITSLREFTALCRMESILLKNVLLSGKPPPRNTSAASSESSTDDSHFGDLLSAGGGEKALGVGFRIYVKAKFNSSQIRAITAAASEYGRGGFTLVKGPPGCGKTTTLVALLNALHLRQYQIYYQEIERIATSGTSQQSSSPSEGIAALNAAARVKPRILVCAPSNAAVDNVILKITQDRFVDGNGGRYNPSIVRVGARQSTNVNNVSLQTQMDTVLAEGTDQVQLDHLIKFCKAELLRFQSEIQKLKRRLRALVEASPSPLSRDWEIRIDENAFEQTGRVLFVNHRLKQTTLQVPAPAGPGEEPHPAEKMPHYRSLMDSLVKYVERHNSTTCKLKQYKLVQTTNQCIARDGRYSRSAQSLVEELETHLINTGHIVLTTLGSAGSKKIQSALKFEVVVVDEAAQSSEPASLVALELGSSHAVLMGDPQQLPATIFSLSGRSTKYDRSLFQRLQEAGHPVHMLDTQYRMDPAISDFPRRIFYAGELLDGPNVKNPQYGGVLSKTVASKFPYFKPFTILDLNSSEERDGTSLANSEEAELALHLYCSMEKATSGMLSKCQVAVITPYSQQASLLKQKFQNHFGANNVRMPVDVSTIDAFQGKEADVVIFSCVRATGGGGGIGFLSDVKRMNVALTRAKHFMFVIANTRTIVVNPYWRDLVMHARECRSVIPVPIAGKLVAYNQNGAKPDTMAGTKFPELCKLPPLYPLSTNGANGRKSHQNQNDESDGNVSA